MFKIGDRVKYAKRQRNGYDSSYPPLGTFGTVVALSNSGGINVKFDNAKMITGAINERFELVKSKTPLVQDYNPEFKVGDKVRFIHSEHKNNDDKIGCTAVVNRTWQTSSGSNWVDVDFDNGEMNGSHWLTWRFEKVESANVTETVRRSISKFIADPIFSEKIAAMVLSDLNSNHNIK